MKGLGDHAGKVVLRRLLRANRARERVAHKVKERVHSGDGVVVGHGVAVFALFERNGITNANGPLGAILNEATRASCVLRGRAVGPFFHTESFFFFIG